MSILGLGCLLASVAVADEEDVHSDLTMDSQGNLVFTTSTGVGEEGLLRRRVAAVPASLVEIYHYSSGGSDLSAPREPRHPTVRFFRFGRDWKVQEGFEPETGKLISVAIRASSGDAFEIRRGKDGTFELKAFEKKDEAKTSESAASDQETDQAKDEDP